MKDACKTFFYIYNFMKYFCLINISSFFSLHRPKNVECQFELEKQESAKSANAKGRLPLLVLGVVRWLPARHSNDVFQKMYGLLVPSRMGKQTVLRR